MEVEEGITVGELMDILDTAEDAQQIRSQKVGGDLTLGKIMEVIGEDRVKEYVQTQAAKASQKRAYDKTYGNIVESWIELILYALIFALFSMIMGVFLLIIRIHITEFCS